MTLDDLHSEFLEGYDNRNLDQASSALFKSMGIVLTDQRQDFEDLLKGSGIERDFSTMSDAALIELYVDNLPSNKNLKLGTALLLNMDNSISGFDGDTQTSDACVKAGYHTLAVFFRSPAENYYAAAGTAIGTAIAESAKLGQQLVKKKTGITDMAEKKQDAKAQMAQMVLSQRQAQIEAAKAAQEKRSKTIRTALIITGAVVVTGIIGVLIYQLKKK